MVDPVLGSIMPNGLPTGSFGLDRAGSDHSGDAHVARSPGPPGCRHNTVTIGSDGSFDAPARPADRHRHAVPERPA